MEMVVSLSRPHRVTWAREGWSNSTVELRGVLSFDLQNIVGRLRASRDIVLVIASATVDGLRMNQGE